MKLRFVFTIGALLAFSAVAAADTKNRCFGSYGNGDCTNKLADECVKLDGGYVLEICPEPGPHKEFPSTKHCPAADSRETRSLCSYWSYALSKERSPAPPKAVQLSLSIPATVRVVEQEGKAQAARAGETGKQDPTAQVLQLSGHAGVFRFVTTLANREPRFFALKVEGSRETAALPSSILGPSARSVEAYTQTDKGWTDTRGNRVIVRTNLQGDEISTEVFDRSGKPLKVRTVPLKKTLFCLPPEDGSDAHGQIPISKYDCRPITFLPIGTFLETGGVGDDPCRLNSAGVWICW